MPELPEVESIRRQLEPNLTGQKILAFEWQLARILHEGDPDSLIGATITSIQRKGKHLILQTDRSVALFVHLRMTGTLLWDSKAIEDKYCRVRIILDNGVVTYRDIRTLGELRIRRYDDPPWNDLALDPTEPGFSSAYLKKQLTVRKISIKQALLDQSIVSGIGNIYAAEILFRAKVHPLHTSADLNESQLSRIARFSTEVLLEAIASSGTTFRDFRLTDGREGAFQEFLCVYGKEGEPCRVCGGSIIRIVQAQRSTYFCPTCQSPPQSENRKF